MKYLFVILFICFTSTLGAANSKAEKEIQAVFAMQEKAWNEGNLEKFMEGYWKSDQLVFVGSRGPTYGWQETLDSYKKGYPDKAAMGKLKFETLKITKIDRKTVLVIGKWQLTKEAGNAGGYFSLVWQKIEGHWLIIADHSS